ncbi:unnamed protein product [Mucor hiemalis]
MMSILDFEAGSSNAETPIAIAAQPPLKKSAAKKKKAAPKRVASKRKGKSPETDVKAEEDSKDTRLWQNDINSLKVSAYDTLVL